jgi:hypothetical protein
MEPAPSSCKQNQAPTALVRMSLLPGHIALLPKMMPWILSIQVKATGRHFKLKKQATKLVANYFGLANGSGCFVPSLRLFRF